MKRREAKALGLTTYVTGNPCPHGHISPARKTHNGCCVECDKPQAIKRAAKATQRPEHKARVKRYKQTEAGRASVRRSNDKRRKRTADAYKLLSPAEQQQIADLHTEAVRLEIATGTCYHVDHIKPLSKGGAHHPNNLQILTAEENLKKSDHYH